MYLMGFRWDGGELRTGQNLAVVFSLSFPRTNFNDDLFRQGETGLLLPGHKKAKLSALLVYMLRSPIDSNQSD